MRINKFLALCGLGSRRGVERLVLEGKIEINGKIQTNLSATIEANDVVSYAGQEIKPQIFKYFAVNKPVGYVCTNYDIHAVKQVCDLDSRLKGLSIVGRLDKDSEGLILMTNDGDFCQKYQHPSGGGEKEYVVVVKPRNAEHYENLDRALKFFKCGCTIDGYKTRSAQARVVSKDGALYTFKIVLREGRKRQIRAIFEKAGFVVVSLRRIRIGQFCLGDLRDGCVNEICIS